MQSAITAPMLRDMKSRGEKITMLTAYDYPMAKIADEAGVDVILVGDSLGMVVLGFDDTLSVTMDMMIHHTAAVTRATERALVVADMPFMSYHVSIEEAVRNAGRLIQEGGAQVVKIEGGAVMIPVIERLVCLGIPVIGHLGMTPQSVNKFGGFKVQGKDESDALRIEEDAKALQDVGVSAIVLELVPDDLAKRITRDLDVPTIGIGAGPCCDGQVQVIHDILGLYDKYIPKHAKQYMNLKEQASDAIRSYVDEVRSSKFPEQ